MKGEAEPDIFYQEVTDLMTSGLPDIPDFEPEYQLALWHVIKSICHTDPEPAISARLNHQPR